MDGKGILFAEPNCASFNDESKPLLHNKPARFARFTLFSFVFFLERKSMSSNI